MSDRGPLAMLFLGLVGAYVALGWIADLSIGSSGVTLAWPSAGVAFGAMLYFGPRWWLLPAISIIVMHLTISTVPAAFLPWSVASNVCGALAGVYFVRRRQPDALKRFDISVGTSVLLGGIVLSFVSAAIGVTGLYLSDMTALNTVASGILRWAIGDLLGVIVITPVTLLYLQYHFRKPAEAASQSTHYASITEQRLWIGVLAVTFLLSLWLRSAQPSYALAVISLPLAALIWGAVRLPPAPVVIANAVVWMVAVAAISQGFVGPRPDSTADATTIVAFLSVLAAIPITLSLGTQQSRQTAARLLHRANTDALTGLLNRSAFEYEARRTIQALPMQIMAMAYLDMDRFRLVNDAMSHAVGDELISGVAGVLRANLRATDVLARIGGDEFAILMLNITADDAQAQAQRLCAAVAAYRFQSGEHVATPTVSIGLVTFNGGEEHDFGTLLALADTACFAAKELGGNRIQLATPGAQDLVQQSSDTMRWALRLGNALERNHFRLFCQTIAPLRETGSDLRHFEVLLRLREGNNQMVLPGQFMAAAERYGLSAKVDRYVIDKIMRWFERHPEQVRTVGLCAINLCADSLQDERFLDDLAIKLRASVLRPDQLCFELTETSALRDLGRAQRFISDARALGCRFSLDDFGTGFCSFGYLRSLDVDFFKIDGSFVRDIETSPLSYAIVRSIADIGRVMRKQTIAECVESEQARQRLSDLGVDFAQGYALGRPIDISEFFNVRPASQPDLAKLA